MINADFVPVWINVRTTPLPRSSFVAEVLVGAKVDGDNKVVDPFSKGFFLRSVVLSPDGQRILNHSPRTVAGSLGEALRDGTQVYATIDTGDYLSMLGKALKRHRGEL
ncbi:MAG: hypothetical protein JWN44_466 [Myxococcales bacterium]|nr:hypothetical protein [Myxococcales bacterium]